ncbi:tRNA (adenosine(37)-N6)-threonylcarbamoyltransferase complex ATPase subunit type 1 TsaE [bacterium]|nr:tRNA (adenosine(37)-N6)-threonylcarbamoyltransferase complex ATPase subunit type 1 TsaE [bacterium]
MNSEIFTNSPIETIDYASNFISQISPVGKIIILSGELGSGKTQFTKGIFKGLGYENYMEINSPTFSILNTYDVGGIDIHHFDLYRLDTLSEEDKNWLSEILEENNIVIIENLKTILPKVNREVIYVNILITHNNQRKIEIKS